MHADSVLNLPRDRRMLDVVRAGLASADDVRIAVSFTRCSGLGLLIDPLQTALQRKASVRVLTSTYQSITQPEALETLATLGVDTRVQTGNTGFHAKFWWFKQGVGGECWAGSSNLSKGGLADNLEWNLRRVDDDAMEATRRQFDALWSRDDVHALNEALIRKYRAIYRAQSVPPRLLLAADEAPKRPNAAQVEALKALADLRARGERRAAVIAATGVGKTYLAAFDLQQSGARTALYVSHRLEHLLQAQRSFRDVFGAQRTFGIVGGGQDDATADVVFATVASLTRRPDLLDRPFDYLVIDEFHHAEAPSYRTLRRVRDRAFLLGLTATPERQDGHDVLEWCDWNIAYEVRLTEAIDRKWLLPFHYFGIADDTVAFEDVPWRSLDAVEDALSVEARAAMVLRHARERGFDGPKRATVGFCAGRKHAQFMADAFCRMGETALAVLGDAKVEDREAIYARLADPDDALAWLFVADVLNEGVDIPAVNAVLFLRPTESATVFLQQLGRGLRLFPGTEVLTVLDFVGHHRSAWLTLQALHAPQGGGRTVEVANGVQIQPPAGCEIVLQQRTREILAKVKRFASKREACADTYQRVREALGRPPLPVDLWSRTDAQPLSAFRAAYGSWVAAQRAHGDLPAWARELPDEHPVFAFLRSAEADWQAQRVSPYALVWALCADPDDPERGYEAFFAQWPQWTRERSKLNGSKTWDTVRRKLGPALDGERLLPEIRAALGTALREEVEGRLMFTINSDHQQRHGGVLRTPADLHLFSSYDRPQIIRHFGVHYDPARHNTGMLWFGDDGVIITKLDTSGAKTDYQYANALVDPSTFSWTSQNKMGVDNAAGRRLLRPDVRLHLFVQPGPHVPAVYLGIVRVKGAEGAGPMRVGLALGREVPDSVLGG